MKLYQQMITEFDLEQILKDKCYSALEEICEIIKNEEYSDKECFEKIERIISVYNKIGVSCGTRHDF